MNAGGPIWGLDWCPLAPGTRPALAHTHFLALAPWPSQSFAPRIGARSPRPACVQIWELSRAAGARCALVLCTPLGPAHELRWCPLPAHSDVRAPAPWRARG
jgi:transcription factor C subunit 6